MRPAAHTIGLDLVLQARQLVNAALGGAGDESAPQRFAVNVLLLRILPVDSHVCALSTCADVGGEWEWLAGLSTAPEI